MENKTSVKRASTLGVICYGLGDLASQFIWTFVGSYLTIFYTDIVGFAPVIVSGIMLLARVWDAINDVSDLTFYMELHCWQSSAS